MTFEIIAPQLKSPEVFEPIKNDKRVRNAIVTYWGDMESAPEPGSMIKKNDCISYVIRSSKERAPETEGLHFHYYLEFTRSVRYSYISKLLKTRRLKIFSRRGSAEQARDYCKPSYYSKKRGETKREYTAIFGDEFLEAGEISKQGLRSDWREMWKLIVAEAATIRYWDVANLFPHLAIRYSTAIKKAISDARYEHFIDVVIDKCVHLFTGDAGSGKDTWVRNKYGARNVYELVRDDQGAYWWDGYTGQDVLLISDFDGKIPRDRLLALLSDRIMRVNVKGSTEWFTGTKVYITSNSNPESWYTEWNPEQDPAFTSRINSWEEFVIEDESEYVYVAKMPKKIVRKVKNYRARKKSRQRKEQKPSITCSTLLRQKVGENRT